MGELCVILDAVLPALDASVGQHVLQELIMGLLGSTCRLIVTNDEAILCRCDLVAAMEDGKCRMITDWRVAGMARELSSQGDAVGIDLAMVHDGLPQIPPMSGGGGELVPGGSVAQGLPWGQMSSRASEMVAMFGGCGALIVQCAILTMEILTIEGKSPPPLCCCL